MTIDVALGRNATKQTKISLLYLDLYVLRGDGLISKGSFMRTKHPCTFLHFRIKGEVGNVKHV